MHPAVVEAYNALNTVKSNIVSAVPNDTMFNQLWGWNMPSMTRTDLVNLIEKTQSNLERIPETANTADLSAALSTTQPRITFFLQNVLVNIAGGNAVWVVLQIRDELNRLDQIAMDFTPPVAPDWRKLAESGYIPKKIADRFSAMERRISQLSPQMDELERKIGIIENGYEAADQLPETLASLEQARREVGASKTQAQAFASNAADEAPKAIELTSDIKILSDESKRKFSDLDDAY